MTKKEMARKELTTNLRKLWEIGLNAGFQVIMEGGPGYRVAREISNSRFKHNPAAVAFPKTAEHVRTCREFCRSNKINFRIRSGGHQHEGMSSLSDGLTIRLSEMNQIEYPDTGFERAWIPVGKPLKDIYDELELHGKTIPGGGCWGVNVGGLTLGGGWGTSIRKMGLTCDNFEQAEVVLANGDIVQARADNEHQDLFWALRGGGGGNFGIVTRFLFRLTDIGPAVSSCVLQWKMPEDKAGKAKLLDLIKFYLKEQGDFPAELTSVMSFRVDYVRDHKKNPYYAIAIVGKYYGSKAKLKSLMQPFMDKLKVDKEEFWPKEKKKGAGLNTKNRVLLSDTINHFVDGYSGEGFVTDGDYKKKAPPGTTCLEPLPHKISSGYPKNIEVYDQLAEKLFRIIQEKDRNGKMYSGVRLYIVLHGMPGKLAKVEPKDSAFYFRDKEFLVQFQAWWQNPGFGSEENFKKEWKAYRKDEKEYIDWIKNAREALDDELEGAFINFVDKEIPLEEYYGGNFKKLRKVKKQYDPNNEFNFQMSIPPAE